MQRDRLWRLVRCVSEGVGSIEKDELLQAALPPQDAPTGSVLVRVRRLFEARSELVAVAPPTRPEETPC